jgi:hypothetical protein
LSSRVLACGKNFIKYFARRKQRSNTVGKQFKEILRYTFQKFAVQATKRNRTSFRSRYCRSLGEIYCFQYVTSVSLLACFKNGERQNRGCSLLA